MPTPLSAILPAIVAAVTDTVVAKSAAVTVCGHDNDQESEIPSVIIPVSLQVGHLPVPPQFGHFSWSELRATFRPVPKHR